MAHATESPVPITPAGAVATAAAGVVIDVTFQP
jgi:hypothetical protein